MKSLIVVLLVVVLTLMLVALAWQSRTPLATVSVHFHGMSNTPAGGRVGIFSITNEVTKRRAEYEYFIMAEVLQTNRWTIVSPPGWAAFRGSLKPAQGRVCVVPEPATNQVWRLCVSVRETYAFKRLIASVPWFQKIEQPYDYPGALTGVAIWPELLNGAVTESARQTGVRPWTTDTNQSN